MWAARWLIALLLLSGYAAPASADIGVLRVLGEDTRSSDPGSFARLGNGTVLFSADDGVHGRELWRTDGTAAGTALVADLEAGPAATWPGGLTRIGETVYFWTETPKGMGFWRTDGTAAGTVQFLAGPPGVRPPLAGAAFRRSGDEVVFDVPGTTGWAELWATDGTSGGTHERAELPGAPPGASLEWEPAGGELYYLLSGSLRRTDGADVTAAGPAYGLTAVGEHLVVTSAFGLYVLAPGSRTPTLLESAAENPVPAVIGDRVYYAGLHGLASWAPGEPVRELSAARPVRGQNGFDGASVIGRSGTRLFWNGRVPDEPAQLWTGDEHGAEPVGAPVVDAHGFVDLGDGRVLFTGRRSASDLTTSLWVSDGTAAGTRPLTEESWFSTRDIAVAGGGIVGIGETARTGRELFRFDEAAGASLLVDINRRTVGSAPAEAARVGARVVFRTDEQEALWTTDGTAEGTVALSRRGLAPSGIDSDGMTAFFAGVDGVYRTDGTAGGTARIADPGLDPFSFTGLGRLGPAYLFTAGPAGAPSDEADLWRTDGTASGTQRLTANLDLSFPFVSAANGGTMLIGNGPGLWATDGTAAGSRKLFSDQPTRFGGDAFPVDDGFLAGVDDPVDGHQLWHLDPAGSNPRLMKTFAPGLAGRYPRSFGQVGTRVLFSTQDGPGSWQWHALELATGQVEPLSGLRGRPELDPPVTVGGVTYLTTYESTGTMLYRTDGTSAGTTLLHRFEGEFSDVPHAFTGYGGVTWFVAEDDEHGTELWRTDGTVEGTRLERDFIPGWLSSYPRDLVATDDFLFFVVDDPEYGTEPWRIRMPAVTRPGEAEPAPEPEPTLAPLPAPVTPIVSPTTPKPAPPRFGSPKLRPSVAVRSQRLRAGGGKARWRVAGSVAETSCFGRVRISLGRGDRTVTRVSTPLRRCRFSAVVTAGRRTAVRWVQVRTVPSPLLDAATSRRRPIA